MPALESVQNPEKEREAWREHFESIQRGREIAEERVWANIPQTEHVAEWMDAEPTDEEMGICIRKMQTGRAAGEDKVVAEYLKCGGPTLRKQIYFVKG